MEFAKWQIKKKEIWFRRHSTLKVQFTEWAMREVISLLSLRSKINYKKNNNPKK